MPFSPVPDLLADLRAGRMIVLTDDQRRENEGDLVLPAQFASAEAITFMLTVARGYLCLALTGADCDRLDLHPQAPANTAPRRTAFTVSVDGHPRHGFTTGVSAAERARCIRMMIDPAFGPADFVRPGHVNPLRARDGGVLVRTGQTEGSVDLCRLAGLYPAAVIIEIMRDDGEMARLPDLERLCARHGLKMGSVAQVIEHRLARESLVRRLEPAAGLPLRTPFGLFTLIAYDSIVDPQPHLALTVGGVGAPGSPPAAAPTLVRVHRRHLLGDVFGDLDASDDGPTSRTLHAAMHAIQREGRGVIVYLRPEGADPPASFLDRITTIRRADDPHRHDPDVPDLRGFHRAAPPPGRAGDAPAVHPGPAPASQGTEASAPSGVTREIGVGSQILRDLGVTDIRLLTNHTTEWPGLEAFGLRVVERVPIRAPGPP
jgi:3,4-dihydroxy 2-butanone 4-phosphate synthase/GTP cyclohydrolase II